MAESVAVVITPVSVALGVVVAVAESEAESVLVTIPPRPMVVPASSVVEAASAAVVVGVSVATTVVSVLMVVGASVADGLPVSCVSEAVLVSVTDDGATSVAVPTLTPVAVVVSVGASLAAGLVDGVLVAAAVDVAVSLERADAAPDNAFAADVRILPTPESVGLELGASVETVGLLVSAELLVSTTVELSVCLLITRGK